MNEPYFFLFDYMCNSQVFGPFVIFYSLPIVVSTVWLLITHFSNKWNAKNSLRYIVLLVRPCIPKFSSTLNGLTLSNSTALKLYFKLVHQCLNSFANLTLWWVSLEILSLIVTCYFIYVVLLKFSLSHCLFNIKLVVLRYRILPKLVLRCYIRRFCLRLGILAMYPKAYMLLFTPVLNGLHPHDLFDLTEFYKQIFRFGSTLESF